MRKTLALLPLLLVLCLGSAPAQDRIDIGTVPVGGYSQTSIALPHFEIEDGMQSIAAGFFTGVIANDLTLYSTFKVLGQDQFIARTAARDREIGRVDYAEWQRLGANILLTGSVRNVQGEGIVAECRLYDVDVREEIFGRRYRGYTPATARRLAHRVSDEIRKEVFNSAPVCNTQILYVARAATGNVKDVWIMDADGHNKRQLTNDNSLVATPAWGMNMTEIYYTSYKDYNPDLYILQIPTGKVWPISRRPNLNYGADWEPRSERIVLTLGRDGNQEIYTMARNGREETLQRLTWAAAIDCSPAWNPAGRQILFTSDRTGSQQIYVMDEDGRNVRRLTHQGRYNDSADWSPRGDRIAYVSRSQGSFDVYTMDIDGGNVRRLTNDPANNEDPVWSPDGEHLLFSSNRTGSYQLYVMRSDGSNVHPLTNGGHNQSPAWSPGESFQ